MAAFTSESLVRLRFLLADTALAPPDLVSACIADAHEHVLRLLDPAFDTDPPAEGLVAGETLLAGAAVFRALAARDALDQRRVAMGGQRIEEGRRFDALRAVAADATADAWVALEPYLRARPARVHALATDTAPVLGED